MCGAAEIIDLQQYDGAATHLHSTSRRGVARATVGAPAVRERVRARARALR